MDVDVDLRAFENGTITEKKKPIGTRVNETDMPNVMKTMLRMMGQEKGHNHRVFRRNVCVFLGIGDFGKIQYITSYDNGKSGKDVKKYDAKAILSQDFTEKGEDKTKKLWARYLFDTYTMLCTKIANNFIRYDRSYPNYEVTYKKEHGEEEVVGVKKGGLGNEKPYIKEEGFDEKDAYTVKKDYKEETERMHVNKLGAIDVLNDKRKIKNILRDFSQRKKYLAERGNWHLPGTDVPDKVEYGLLINSLNASIKGFAADLLEWCTNESRDRTALLPIMEKMDEALSGILKKVDAHLEMKKRSSTIKQPWNKACNLKKCGQFLYSKCKLGNNVITGQLFSGKNSRSGKPKYKEILNDCIENLKKLGDQKKEAEKKELF